MLRVIVASGALLGLSAFSSFRDENVDAPILWPAHSATMMIQQDGSKDVTDGSAIVAIRNAMAAWSAQPCSSFHFVDGGLSASRAFTQDGVNNITFLETNWPGSASGAAAITQHYRDMSTMPSTWTEADVAVNGQQAKWATDGSAHSFDIQSAVTHELGHVLGLEHAVTPEATMYFDSQPGLTYKRTLHADDIAGLCYLYPQGAFSCAADTQCPLFYGAYGGANDRQKCIGSSCSSGAVGYGGDCYQDADCTSGICLANPQGVSTSDPGFCSQACTLGQAGSCPGQDVCGNAAGQARCYVGHDNCVHDSDCTPTPNHVCAQDLDGRFRCLYLCVINQHCSVVPGAVCQGGISNSLPGFCRTPGTKNAGDACQSGLECKSLVCAGGGTSPVCVGNGVATMDAGGGGLDGAVHNPDASGPQPDALISGFDAGSGDAGSTTGGGGDSAHAGDDGGTAPAAKGGCVCVRPQKGEVAPWGAMLAALFAAGLLAHARLSGDRRWRARIVFGAGGHL
jgi:hypothetical protein